MSSSGQHLPSSAAESLSPTHDDRASSTRRDQEPSASDIELVPLVPAVYSSLQPQEGADSLIDKTSHRTPPTDAFRLASRQPHLYNNKPSATTRLLLDSWVYEAVAIGLSIACLAAIAAIVAYYDEKAVPESVITLNTAVSVLSTAAAVSSGLPEGDGAVAFRAALLPAGPDDAWHGVTGWPGGHHWGLLRDPGVHGQVLAALQWGAGAAAAGRGRSPR